MAKKILTSIHGSRFGLTGENELVVERPDTAEAVAIATPYFSIERVFKQITSAQLLALNATPIEVIAAQGANKAIIPLQVKVYKPAGTAYSGIAAGEDLVLKYTNASGAIASSTIETTGFLDQTTAQVRVGGTSLANVTPVANAAIVAHLLAGEITTGDSDLYIEVIYTVTDVVFTA
jgi:hypothetical protein